MTLRVIVQIVPFGDESKARELGRLDISNITAPTPTTPAGTMADYIVRGHRREDGFWALIRKVLNEAPT